MHGRLLARRRHDFDPAAEIHATAAMATQHPIRRQTSPQQRLLWGRFAASPSKPPAMIRNDPGSGSCGHSRAPCYFASNEPRDLYFRTASTTMMTAVVADISRTHQRNSSGIVQTEAAAAATISRSAERSQGTDRDSYPPAPRVGWPYSTRPFRTYIDARPSANVIRTA